MDPYKSGFSIGELPRQTGLGVSTLRAWEIRHGFPVPQRLPSGHRRYTEQDLLALDEVLKERRAGSTLEAALARARARAGMARSSVLATLRQSLPDLAPLVLSKDTMLALSRAIEDEAAVRAEHPILLGAFQEERFWRQTRGRWRDMAPTSLVTVALAAITRRGKWGPLWEVPLQPTEPLTREWAIICDSPTFSGCLVGVELPGGRDGPDGQRRFEALWTVEPAAVREAARAAGALAAEAVPELSLILGPRLREPALATHDSLRAATALTNRVISYLESIANTVSIDSGQSIAPCPGETVRADNPVSRGTVQ